MQNQFVEKVLVGVVTAIVLGGLALAWNSVSNGALVRALGGLTKDEVAQLVKTETAGLGDYKVKDLFLHTCPGSAGTCACPPGYSFAKSTDAQPETNSGAPSVSSRLLCIK